MYQFISTIFVVTLGFSAFSAVSANSNDNNIEVSTIRLTKPLQTKQQNLHKDHLDIKARNHKN
jgi:hypothetical protein